jgi:hypothetical protein
VIFKTTKKKKKMIFAFITGRLFTTKAFYYPHYGGHNWSDPSIIEMIKTHLSKSSKQRLNNKFVTTIFYKRK